MESSHLVIFSTSGKFIMKFNVLRCISLSETLFWTGARGRIPIILTEFFFLLVYDDILLASDFYTSFHSLLVFSYHLIAHEYDFG